MVLIPKSELSTISEIYKAYEEDQAIRDAASGRGHLGASGIGGECHDKIITSKQAKKLGLKKYFTGKPCKHGHVSERATVNSTCVECKILMDAKNYEKSSEKIKNRVKKYSEENKEKITQSKHEYSMKNKDEAEKRKKEWRKNNIERVREKAIQYSHTRRLRVRGFLGILEKFTPEEFLNVKIKQNFLCNACKIYDEKLTSDHIISLNNGGSNSIENIQALCGKCNSSKGDKDYNTWLKQKGYSNGSNS